MTDDALRDYVAWHRHYDDPTSALSARLRCVQDEIRRWLDDTAPDPVSVISLCAGDGRDLLDVLAERDDVERVEGVLLEILPDLVAAARARIDDLGLIGLEVAQVDASHTDAFDGLESADLVIVSGVMGNLSEDDIAALIGCCAALTHRGSRVIWNRADTPPDPIRRIRDTFDHSGFRRLALHERIEGTRMRVGVEESTTDPGDLGPPRRLFTFLK